MLSHVVVFISAYNFDFFVFYGSIYSPKLYPQKKMMQTCLLE